MELSGARRYSESGVQERQLRSGSPKFVTCASTRLQRVLVCESASGVNELLGFIRLLATSGLLVPALCARGFIYKYVY